MAGPPDSLVALVERFDPEVFDAPTGRARVRLEVRGQGEWDVTIRPPEARLKEANPDRRPDAVVSADPHAWRRVASDLAGGMAEHAAAG